MANDSTRPHQADANRGLLTCPECGLAYRDAKWAKLCEAWCREHQSCNIDIITHAIPDERPALQS